MNDLELLIRDKYDGDAEKVSEQDKERLACGEPLAYVIGWVPFLGVRVYLDSLPLIPRPETEWWSEELIKHIQSGVYGASCSVLDLCAGSGAIGLALLKHLPNVYVTFAEIEAAHHETIRKSINENGLDASRVSFATGDLFENVQGRFDVVACNPPYIPSERELDRSVREFEPHEALFSGSDGLDLIRRLISDAPAFLNKGGALWLEADISNIEAARDLLLAAGAHEAVIRDDLYGRPRLVVAYY